MIVDQKASWCQCQTMFKGSASHRNKLALLIYRNSVVLIFFPGLVINTDTNFQKTLPPAVSATTRCLQQVVANYNEWSRTTSGCKQRVVVNKEL